MKVATIVFPVSDGKIWLPLKIQGFGTGWRNGYGGKFKPDIDKDIEAGAVREFGEESGASTTRENLEKVAVLDFYEETEHVFECHVYFCRKWDGELKASEEMAAPEVFDLSQIPYDAMWPGDRIWLPIVFAGKKIRAKIVYKKGNKEVDSFEYEPL